MDRRADAGALFRHALRRSEEAGGRDGDLAPGAFSARYREITAEPGYLDGVLREAAGRAAPIANATVELVKRRMGLYVSS